MDRNVRQALSRAYFDRDQLSTHQHRSFNRFLSSGIQSVINHKGGIKAGIQDTSHDKSLRVDFGQVSVGAPQSRESRGESTKIFPQEARLRNLTYSAPIHLEMSIVVSDDQESKERVLEEDSYEIGQLPIMIKSTHCNLHGLTRSEVIKRQEDPADPGGYFIVNGSERVLVTYEDLLHNRILVEYKDADQTNPVAKVFSENQGYRKLTTVTLGDDNLLSVSIPSIPNQIAFPLLIRALGIETDKAISSQFRSSSEVMQFVVATLEEAETVGQETAIEKLGRILVPNSGQDSDSEYVLSRVNTTLLRSLLPHLNNSHGQPAKLAKARFLCDMAETCIDLKLESRDPVDKDHYKNKRLKTAGELMEDLFRSALNRLERDIKYHVKRAYRRDRRIEIDTVLQRELLSSQMKQALATGTWVGGRSGVSQLAERTNYIALLSQLRRVQSPLARSRPHIAARELHATQWGRICPSETPEGTNCGLKQNLAQGGEFSTRIDDETALTETLKKMGVDPLNGTENRTDEKRSSGSHRRERSPEQISDETS